MGWTLEQERASFALDRIKVWRDKTANDRDSYARFVQRFPAMVLTSGLGQTLAFLLADNEGARKPHKPSGVLYNDLGEWLVVRRKLYRGTADKLIDLLISGDRSTYQQATEEALALSVWLSRFADAFLQKGSSNREETNQTGK
jgi:CRISPR-associated protein Cmr5